MQSSSEGSAPPRGTHRILRFLAVGVANTGLDVGLLFGFLALGLNLWLANTLSTSLALVFSFFLNRSFTFSSSGSAFRQGVSFLLVTLTGLWLLQPLVMSVVVHLAADWLSSPWLLLCAKGIATVFSMTWNYILYSRLVFRKQEHN